jgi:hypothetical protein
MADSLPRFADFELYPDEASAIAALLPAAAGWAGPAPDPSGSAAAPEVLVVDGVTVIRPNDAAIRDENLLTRPGLRYRDLVRHHGHCIVVLDLAGLRPFGHPFHDDIFAMLRELGSVGGRLAVCGAETWYTDRLLMYRRLVRVVVADRVAPDAAPGDAADGGA